MNLIANYITPHSGTRTLDSLPFEQLSQRWFGENSVFLSQETELFNLSVRNNLMLGRTMQEERLLELLDHLGLSEWLGGLEKGLDTIVGEKGTRLSAGQKQRLNLARGILLDRDLYFLDEPTSHLDDNTEEIVIGAIKRYLGDKTLVIVTHRPAIK